MRTSVKAMMWLVMLVAMWGAGVLVKRVQENRRSAYFAEATLSLWPEKKEVSPGEEFTVSIKLNVGDKRVSGVSLKLDFDDQVLAVENVSMNTSKITGVGKAQAQQASIYLVGFIINSAQDGSDLPTGQFDVGTIKFRAIKEGGSTVSLDRGASQIVGMNTGGDPNININYQPATYTVKTAASGTATVTMKPTATGTVRPTMTKIPTATLKPNVTSRPSVTGSPTATAVPTITIKPTVTIRPTATAVLTITAKPTAMMTPKLTVAASPRPTVYKTNSDMVLNFKISYLNMDVKGKCSDDWPLTIIVQGEGGSRIYTGVIPERDVSEPNRAVFKKSLVLEGFEESEGAAVFIKGVKHIQTKYGINNQVGFYNKAGGEIKMTSEAGTSPWYDFSGYPLWAGDVRSNTGEGQDGVVNGADFAYVKRMADTHQTWEPGESRAADLDGNCQYNSLDVNIIRWTLKEKMELMY